MDVKWNEKEKKVLKAMELDQPVSLEELAKACFRSVGVAPSKRGNSWVRNSVRKPLRLKVIRQLGRGLYVKVKPENPPKTSKKTKNSRAGSATSAAVQ